DLPRRPPRADPRHHPRQPRPQRHVRPGGRVSRDDGISATALSSPKHRVFLSHSSADKPAVEEIARALKRRRIEPWLDKWNLIPGDPWQEAIEEALASCDACAVFIGPG